MGEFSRGDRSPNIDSIIKCHNSQDKLVHSRWFDSSFFQVVDFKAHFVGDTKVCIYIVPKFHEGIRIPINVTGFKIGGKVLLNANPVKFCSSDSWLT